MTLKNKIVLITGSGEGLGAATAKLLAQHDMIVVLSDTDMDKAQHTAALIKQNGGQAEAISLDVSNDVSCSQARDYIMNTYGGLDVLINNAGTDVTLPFIELTQSEFDKVMSVNLRGPIMLSKLFLPDLMERAGYIINIGSTAAKRMWPNATAYHTSKWGLRAFSHALYTEAREHNVKVCCVIPGGMKTSHLLKRFPDIDLTKLQEPSSVARVIQCVLTQPDDSIIPEVMVLPLLETSWP